MFEFSIAFRYLLPKRRALSTSLIALLSILVISLVVWLLVVFLSITAGMEKRWLGKMTSLHAPVRISPTEKYYDSYYYNVDHIAYNSDFQFKTIGEKQRAITSDPYDKELDRDIPSYWRSPDKNKDGSLKDPVKEASFALEQIEGLRFEDYEMSAALMKLELEEGLMMDKKMLSQMSYMLSFNQNNPGLSDLLIPPRVEDLNALLKNLDLENTNAFFNYANIEAFHVDSQMEFIISQLTLNKPLSVFTSGKKIVISDQKKLQGYKSAILSQENNNYYLDKKLIDSSTPFSISMIDEASGSIKALDHVVAISFDKGFRLHTAFFPFSIAKASPRLHFSSNPKLTPLWTYSVKDKGCFFPEGKKAPLLLPKSYQKSGAYLGAVGDLAYQAVTATSPQEQAISFRVAGFYDPGVMPMGSRLIIAPVEVIRAIDTTPIGLDDTPLNGLFVWFDDVYKAGQYKKQIEEEFEAKGIAQYWKVEDFTEYGFAKDLFEQFKSDRVLFTLIGIIILIVACCNIISLLIVLVNDKKKEIAILQALGAKPKSIAFIFGLCGMILGTIGAFIGSAFAVITLRNLDKLTTFLSSMQGHDLFNAAFFGEKLPSSLSVEALMFVSLATPIIALLAGLVPAIKAARIKPAKVLRSV